MIKLDDNLLTELGLQTLPPEEKRALLKQIYETLEMRVGTTLARQMTDAQLDEFEGFITRNDEQGALHWLETNFPNYKDVVSQEFEVLKNEVRQASPQILASAQAHHQQYAQMPQQTPPQAYQQPQYADPYAQPAPGVAQQPTYQQYATPAPQQQQPQQYGPTPYSQPPQQNPVDQTDFEQAA